MSAAATPQWLDDDEMRFWRSFILTATLLESRLNRELVEGHGISHSDYSILVVLSEAPDHQMRMSALADFIASSKSRLSHQVARMEKAGLVERQECDSDGRGVLAVMLPKGRELLERAAPTHVAGVRDHVISRLSADEQRSFADALERVLQGLSGSDEVAEAS
ncbi:MarR family winged helix-turn-helix transcriptional regulator [Pseudonocardia benzenivorans]|uniref:Regulatory protein MarR n=2 Tax=Pseudonocardia TaxID=1847 RepID=F4CM01_PSEUX|nr:MarR family transcriptional regulator [Pseudonocardia dioxanivorans]AEA22488.1 regulatory protein MarR [Pseudonocardia dioxanivorans CB1190]GJF02279.1 MarR family transcriptional regulator [Pseudonocardia sp. D17]